MKSVTDKLIRFFASVEWSLLLLRFSFFLALFFIACNWGVFDPRGTLFSEAPSSVLFERIHHGIALYPSGGFWLVVFAIVLLLILVHLCVVILVRNSGGRHATLSTVQGMIAVWMLVGFFLIVSYRYYEVDTQPGLPMRFLSLPDAYELTIIDHSNPEHDKVYAIDWEALRSGKILHHKDWDFHLRVNVRYPRAVFADLMAHKVDSRGKQVFGIVANQGFAVEQEIKMFSADENSMDSGPGMLLEVFDYDHERLGTYLLGTNPSSPIPPQEIQIDDRDYSVVLQAQRVDPGFQWKLMPATAGKNTMLQIMVPDRKPVEKPIGFLQSPKYRGYRFHLFPNPSESPVDFNTVHVGIVRNPWGTLFAIVTILTILAAVVHCIIHLRMLSREVDL